MTSKSKITDQFQMDEFATDDPIVEMKKDLIVDMVDDPDGKLEAAGEEFERFVETLPTELMRRVAWNRVFDTDPSPAAEYGMKLKDLRRMIRTIRRAMFRYRWENPDRTVVLLEAFKN